MKRRIEDPRSSGSNIYQFPFEVCHLEFSKEKYVVRNIPIPFCSGSKHSNVISNWYLASNGAGLLRILTPRSDTTDMAGVYSTWISVDCVLPHSS